jgi:hypothetical protein
MLHRLIACRYKQLSTQFYTILMSHADDLQAVSVDEALIDVTSRVRAAEDHAMAVEDHDNVDYAHELAEVIRAQIHAATGCTGELFHSWAPACIEKLLCPSKHWYLSQHHVCEASDCAR